MFLTVIFGASTSFNYWITTNLKELFLLLLSGVFGFIAVFYMTKSFQKGKINIVAPIKYLEVIIAVIIGFFYFGERYTVWTFLGVLLILVSILNNFYFRIKSS